MPTSSLSYEKRLVACLMVIACVVGIGFAQATPGSAQPAQDASFQINLWSRIESGGPVMIPIGICSVLVLAFTFERFVNLRRGKVAPSGFVDDVDEIFKEEGRKGALEFCREEKHSLARVIETGLSQSPSSSRDELRSSVEASGRREVALLRRNLRTLSVTAAVAPLLGLLGTVGGMIEVFDKYSAAAEATDKVQVFSSGISKALVTTFAGLSVSIPATVIYHFFVGRITRFTEEVQRAYALIFEPMSHRPLVRSSAAPTEVTA